MNNPFSGNKPPVKRPHDLIGRQAAADRLERLIQDRMNAVIMGPEGIGKSSFLNAFFSRDRRLRMARDEHILIVRTMFPVHLAGDKVYHYLADAIESSLSILWDANPKDAEDLIPEVERKRSFAIGSSRLQEICKAIEEKYDITMVIDDFENFTSSKYIEMEHHAIMLNLFRQHYACYVVATNYDFNKDSLPHDVSGSFLLMAFSGNEVLLEGFSAAECKQYLEAQGANGCFSDAECARMWTMSGGIPALLRITAEYTWNQKQITPVLDEDTWFSIQEQLFDEPRVSWYFSQWCRILTSKHVAVFNKLMEESNRLGLINDQDITSAAQALEGRGLLVPRRRDGRVLEDCYDFNSDLLADYCYNTVLTESDPYEAQKFNIAKQLKEMVENGETAAVLELLQDTCGMMDNVTMPFDFGTPLSNEILQQFALNQEVLDGFDEFVRDEISTGIRVERTFQQVHMRDYSPVYISFAKAIEAHLNKTIVPLLKKVTPNHVLAGHRTLRSVTGTLMLGEIYTIIGSRLSGLHTTVIDEAAAYCTDHDCPDFDSTWWDALHNDLNIVKALRNNMPHPAPLSSKEGASLLKLLFLGDDSFTYRCTSLSDALADALIPDPEPVIRVGTVLTGTVKNVMGRGAYVDVGAARDGYLHISEIKYGYVSDLNDELYRGQQVNVRVISYDEGRQDFKVSMKDVPQD